MSRLSGLPVRYTRSQGNHIVSLNKIRFISLYTIKHLVTAGTAAPVVYTLFLRSIHFLENISRHGITATVRGCCRIIMLTAIAAPVNYRFQTLHAFACGYSGRCRYVPATHDGAIFVAAALKQSHTVRRVEIIGIGKVGRTLQAVTTHGSHIHHYVAVGGFLYQIIVIKEPAGSGIHARSVPRHPDMLFFHFFP